MLIMPRPLKSVGIINKQKIIWIVCKVMQQTMQGNLILNSEENCT
jgi:hypothetical protein